MTVWTLNYQKEQYIYKEFISYLNQLLIINNNWCCTKSVSWTLQFRWTTSGCGRSTKWIHNQKGRRSGPIKHSPMAKLVSQGWSSNFLGVKCQRKCTYPRFVQTGPFYRDLVVVISSVTSPRFTEANEYEHNFLNDYRSCNR